MNNTPTPFPTIAHKVIVCNGATAWWVVVWPKSNTNPDTFFPYLSEAREFAKDLSIKHGWPVVDEASGPKASHHEPSFHYLLEGFNTASSVKPRKKPRT